MIGLNCDRSFISATGWQKRIAINFLPVVDWSWFTGTLRQHIPSFFTVFFTLRCSRSPGSEIFKNNYLHIFCHFASSYFHSSPPTKNWKIINCVMVLYHSHIDIIMSYFIILLNTIVKLALAWLKSRHNNWTVTGNLSSLFYLGAVYKKGGAVSVFFVWLWPSDITSSE